MTTAVCPSCHGTGLFTDEEDCPRCLGAGIVYLDPDDDDDEGDPWPPIHRRHGVHDHRPST